jgi:hypothetical protein
MQNKRNPGPSTDRERYALDPTRRWPTRYRGITYRLNRSLGRTYFVYWKGAFISAGKTLEAAQVKQGELRRRVARGERPVLPTKVTFAELAAEWIETKRRLKRRKTIESYEARSVSCSSRAGGTGRWQRSTRKRLSP